MKNMQVFFNVNLPCKLTKKSRWVVSSCPILDIYSQGPTEIKAKKNLAEAVFLFFVSCFERGTLDAVLKECGFRFEKFHSIQNIPFATPRPSKDTISVPIPFTVNSSHTAHACHV